jgi:hypothetical protein
MVPCPSRQSARFHSQFYTASCLKAPGYMSIPAATAQAKAMDAIKPTNRHTPRQVTPKAGGKSAPGSGKAVNADNCTKLSQINKGKPLSPFSARAQGAAKLNMGRR